MPVIPGLEWTFDTVSARYARLRPGYVPELYADIFAYLPIGPESRALEIGIGGGQATEPVLKTGCAVEAVEYGANFCELCREKFRAYPGFSAVNTKFEDFRAEPGSYDLIYAASSFHWIAEDYGYPRVYELLKHGGAFARITNHPYKDKSRPGLHEALQEVYAVYMPGSLNDREFDEAQAKARAELALKYGFTDAQYHLYKRVRTYTADEYIELLGTYSDHVAIPEPRRGEFFGKLRDVIQDFGGKISIFDTMDLELARKA